MWIPPSVQVFIKVSGTTLIFSCKKAPRFHRRNKEECFFVAWNQDWSFYFA